MSHNGLRISHGRDFTKGEGATTDTFAWETYWDTGVSYTIAGKGANVSYPGLPTDPKSAAYLNNYYSWSWGGNIMSPDNETYVRADAEYKFDGDFLKSIKVGGRYTDHKREVELHRLFLGRERPLFGHQGRRPRHRVRRRADARTISSTA